MKLNFDIGQSVIDREAIKKLFNLQSYQIYMIQNSGNLDLGKQSMNGRVKDNELVIRACTYNDSHGYVPLRNVSQPGFKTAELRADFNLMFMTEKHIGPPVLTAFTREQMLELVDKGQISAPENIRN